MTSIKLDLRIKLIIRWLVANTIAWLLGLLLAIILSHLVVNIFHPEETNLIVGLCLGFSLGFAQWLVLKRLMKISILWFIVPAIGIGLPYAWFIMQLEAGNDLPLILNTDGVFLAILFFICGALVGFIQSRLKSMNLGKSYIWILLSGIAWSISLTINSFLFSGLIFGLVTLAAFILILKERNIIS